MISAKYFVYLSGCIAFILSNLPASATEISQVLDTENNFSLSEVEVMQRVTSVSQLSDVQTTDWAFQALQNLIERYGVIGGYPNGTFKGNNSLTRYEFAAALNATMLQINVLINERDLEKQPKKEDLEIIQKLQAEFASELATLGASIDKLEARAANVQAQQFSTTVQLAGQAIFALTAGGGGEPPGKGEANATLTQLTQLQLVSSFTGKDRFRIGLVTGNTDGDGFASPEAFNTNMARLAWQTSDANQVRINSLEYRVAGLGDRVVFTFKPVGFNLSNVLTPTNSIYADAGQGAISLFASSTPILQIGGLDSGLGFDWLVSDNLRLQFAYGTRNGNNNSQGLLDADHSALGTQLLYKPDPSFIASLAYINSYSQNGQLDTGTGSSNADTSGGVGEPAQIHAVNASFRWRLLNNIVLGASGGFAVTDYLKSEATTLSSTYLLSLGIYDPFKRKGDLLGILVGQPLKLNTGFLIPQADTGTSTHYEVFYRFLVNDNISITPGFFIVTDPGNISENNDIFIGAFRTTFTF